MPQRSKMKMVMGMLPTSAAGLGRPPGVTRRRRPCRPHKRKNEEESENGAERSNSYSQCETRFIRTFQKLAGPDAGAAILAALSPLRSRRAAARHDRGTDGRKNARAPLLVGDPRDASRTMSDSIK